jgi:hypothetical protein
MTQINVPAYEGFLSNTVINVALFKGLSESARDVFECLERACLC